MRTLTASDRSSLIRLASGMPKGDPTRRAIIAGLKTAGAFEEAIEGKKFKNPETGNDVVFGSLPAEEQKKIRSQWEEKNSDGGGGGEKSWEEEERETNEAIDHIVGRGEELDKLSTSFKKVFSDSGNPVYSHLESLAPEGKSWGDLSKDEQGKILDKPLSKESKAFAQDFQSKLNDGKKKIEDKINSITKRTHLLGHNENHKDVAGLKKAVDSLKKINIGDPKTNRDLYAIRQAFKDADGVVKKVGDHLNGLLEGY
jgi:hypothetical protein